MLLLKQTKKVVPVLVSMLPMFAMAAPVELRSPDGLISLTGEITSFNNNTITVVTSVGTVQVLASDVTCLGRSCPDSVKASAIEESIALSGITPDNLHVARSFLSTSTASSSRSAISGGLSLANDAQTQVANVSFVPSADTTQGDVIITSVIDPDTAVTRLNTLQDWTQGGVPTQLLAIKALSVVTSPGTGLQNISVAQLAQIYAGELTNWSELGGSDLTITPIQTDIGTRLHDDLREAVLRPARKPVSPMVFTMTSADAILRSLKAIQGAIAVVPTDLVADINTLGISDSCGVTSVASAFSVRAGDYPLTLSTLAVYTGDLQTNVIRAAFDKAAAQGPDTILPDAGYASHTLMALPEEDKNWRIANIMSQDFSAIQKGAAIDLIRLLVNARQLSATFADGDLSQTEGAWTRAHFVRLRSAIASGALDNHDIFFVGFDNNADDALATAQSLEAAKNILAAFTAFAPETATRDRVTFTATGHGALTKIGCYQNGTATGHDNRIEVWVRPAS